MRPHKPMKTHLLRRIALPALIFLTVPWLAQAASVSGFVYGAGNGEALPYANVHLQGTSYGAEANPQGHYAVTGIPPGSYTIVYGYIGYRPETRDLTLKEGEEVRQNVELQPQAVGLEGVEVQAQHRGPAVEPGKLSMRTKELVRIPSAVEFDLFRAVQALPGVSTISDFSSGLYVRGGSPDQNLVLLDNVDVYNPSHLFGFFSTFNVDAVKTVDLQKSGFPAQYGGRLSSVLDVQNRDGNRKKFEGVGRLSIISASTTLEGPWKRGSWMVSARHTYIRPLARAVHIDLPYKFYDLHAKINYDLGQNERTSLSGYLGEDKLDWHRKGTDVVLSWGNQAWSAQWTHLFSTRLFSHFVLGHSRFTSRSTFAFRDFAFESRNEIRDLSLKGSLSYSPSTAHILEFGGETKFLSFDFLRETGEQDRLRFPYDGVSAAAYLEDTWKPNGIWTLQPGLRLDYYSKGDWFEAGPRLTVRRSLNEISSCHATYGRYAQFLNLVSQQGASFADMWFPIDRSVAPGVAQHFILGYEIGPLDGFDLSVEGYYKPYQNLVEFSEEFTRSLVEQSAKLSELFNSGTGKAWGVDLYLRNNFRGFEGWTGYSFGVSRRKISGYNFGKEYYTNYDRRHQFTLMQDRSLGKGWRMNVAFRFGSGQPFTLAAGRYAVLDVNGRERTWALEGAMNAARLPPYHRLDLGISKEFKTHGLFIEPNLQIINLYNRKNVYIRTYDTTKNPAEYQDVTMLPLLPTLGVSVRF